MNYKVSAFYKFVAFSESDLTYLKGFLTDSMKNLEIKGTILLAKEGINGTIAGSVQNIDLFQKILISVNNLSSLEIKNSFTETEPFKKLKVKIKKEILTFDSSLTSPERVTGVRLNSKDWNDLIKNPDVCLIDVRNDYEVAQGTFERAINPNTDKFTDFKGFVASTLDPNKNKKVAMFCTGGIRCEKASSFMMENGFEQVYQLDGGILKYLENTPKEQSLWQGNCYIFDNRESLDHGLAPTTVTLEPK